MRGEFLILMNILLIIMASLFVQCKPENGNGDSTDEEVAFPGLYEGESPLLGERKAPTGQDKACQLIEMLFRNVREAVYYLQKGQKGNKLFSPNADLSFFLIVRDGVANALQKQERIFLKPELAVSTDEGGYRLFTFTLGGKFPQLRVTIACRGEECKNIFETFKRLQDDPSCMKTRHYYIRLDGTVTSDPRALNVELGKSAGREWRFMAIPSVMFMETLIAAGKTVPEKWYLEKPLFDGKSTITLQVFGCRNHPIQLKVFCSDSLIMCNPLTPQRDFYQGLVDVLNLHVRPLQFDKKPRTGAEKFLRPLKRARLQS